jgi:hypothetical protein
MEDRISTRLSASEGRKFGLTVGGAFLLLAAVLEFWRHKHVTAVVLGTYGSLHVVAGLLVPTWLSPVERAWMGLARLISKVTTPIFMGVVFFGVITPIGLVARLFGRRPLVHRATDGSYWKAPPSGGRSDMTRQF